MPRVRSTTENDTLSSICRSLFYYENGIVYYNSDSPYIGRNTKNRSAGEYIPVHWSCQRIKTCTGVCYDYYTVDLGFSYRANNDSMKIMSERLVWFLVYGEWPSGNILFRDGNKRNISIDNLIHENH